MLDWDDLRYFLAVHRAGTLARAGHALGMNPTTVGRRLSGLEEQVQARLFDRTPDGYVLTDAGRDLLPRAERIEGEVVAVEREVHGADQRRAGLVRVSATEMIATRYIAPRLHEFHQHNPEVTIDLRCTRRVVTLGRREADIVLRLARPKEENVITRKLASVHLSLYGSPGYIARVGRPEDPDTSLAGHRLLLFADTRSFRLENEWFAKRLEGAHVVLRSDSVSSLYSAAVGGVGLAMLPAAVADEDPALERIVTRTTPEPRVIWQTVHEDLARNARIRVVQDFLAETLGTPG